jgi:hypothetical protein
MLTRDSCIYRVRGLRPNRLRPSTSLWLDWPLSARRCSRTTGLNGGVPAHWLSRHGRVRDRQAMHDRFPRRDVKSPFSCVPVLLTSTRFAYTRSKCTMSRTVADVAASALQIRTRICDHVYQMPLIPARIVERSSTTLFKAEIFEITGSFKIRGLLSKFSAHADKGHLIAVSSWKPWHRLGMCSKVAVQKPHGGSSRERCLCEACV